MSQKKSERYIIQNRSYPYIQQEGCPTGLRPSGPISRIYMDFWVKMLKEIEEMAKTLHTLNPISFERLTTHLIKKYVDDCLWAGDKLKKGVSFDHKSKSL